MSSRLDIKIYDVYGNLKVLGISRTTRTQYYTSYKVSHWIKCECLLCGNECEVLSYNLKNGNTTSCGCAKTSYYKSNRGKGFRNGVKVQDADGVIYNSINAYARAKGISPAGAYYHKRMGHLYLPEEDNV